MVDTNREHVIPTPVGDALVRVTATEEIAGLKLLRPGRDPRPAASAPAGVAVELAVQIEQYFARARTAFSLPLAPQGSAFQLAVWRELQRIPYGTTTTYGALAARLGQPEAVRAVGSANAANPIWILIPCHRVIGADHSLTGYAGGLAVKRRLLELEGALPPTLFG